MNDDFDILDPTQEINDLGIDKDPKLDKILKMAAEGHTKVDIGKSIGVSKRVMDYIFNNINK